MDKLHLLCTTSLLAIASPLLAHEGHDHAYVPGGQFHHYLWYAGAAVIVGFAVYAAVRKLRSR